MSPRRTTGLVAAARVVITTVAAVAAIIASFVFLRGLAASTGWPGWTGLLLPMSVDALAASAWLTYWISEPGQRRFAGWVGAAATTASLAGNALSHLLVTGQVHAGWFLVAVVGSVPAVSLALVVKMAVPDQPGPVSLRVEGSTKLATNSAPRVGPGGSGAAADGPDRTVGVDGSGTAGTSNSDSPDLVPVKTPGQPVPVPVEVPPPPSAGTGASEAALLNRFLASGRVPTVANVQDVCEVSRRQALKLAPQFKTVIGSGNGHGE